MSQTVEEGTWRVRSEHLSPTQTRIVIEQGFPAVNDFTIIKDLGAVHFHLKSFDGGGFAEQNAPEVNEDRKALLARLGDIPIHDSLNHVVVIDAEELGKALFHMGAPARVISLALEEKEALFNGKAAKPIVEQPAHEKILAAIRRGDADAVKEALPESRSEIARALLQLKPLLDRAEPRARGSRPASPSGSWLG